LADFARGAVTGAWAATAGASAQRRRSGAAWQAETKNDRRNYGLRVEGAKYGVSLGSALSIAVSYGNDHSLLWAIVDSLLGSNYVIYFVLFPS
jgi:hypothetical protein